MRASIAIGVVVVLVAGCAALIGWALARRNAPGATGLTDQQAATQAQQARATAEETDQAHRYALAFYDLLMSGQTTDARNGTTGQARKVFNAYARAVRTSKVTGYTITKIVRAGDSFQVRGYETLKSGRFRSVQMTMRTQQMSRTARGLVASFLATNLSRASKTVSVPPQ